MFYILEQKSKKFLKKSVKNNITEGKSLQKVLSVPASIIKCKRNR